MSTVAWNLTSLPSGGTLRLFVGDVTAYMSQNTKGVIHIPMTYDLDQIIDRRSSDSAKWNHHIYRR